MQASIDGHDGMRWLTLLGSGGLVAAVVLAAIGGLPFDLPMPTHSAGWVTPTCGLTRGSTALVRGDVALAWRYNPASLLVIGFGVFGMARGAAGALTGWWLNLQMGMSRRIMIIAAVTLVALWSQQMSNAQFVIDSRA